MSIGSINTIGTIGSIFPATSIDKGNTNNASFASVLNKAMQDVNKDQLQAYQSMEDMANGTVSNVQEAVQRIQEAELSLKLALEVKNKLVGSYKEVIKMQI
jgi:flagellar hook-basal body complex protein FliE